MKLRNKKTGEIHEITQAVFLSDDMNKKFAIYSQSERNNYAYRTLAELNDEWEDAPEKLKEYWYIYGNQVLKNDCDGVLEDRFKEIGNYFETKEEAELAVEKLKAWKRLKDKNFHFLKYSALGCGEIEFSLDFEDIDDEGEIGELRHDLDLLFGGEE